MPAVYDILDEQYRTASAGRSHASRPRLLRWLWGRAAEAAPPPLLIPGAENFLPQEGAPAPGPFDFLTGISRSGYLLGDIWGLRSLLAQYGISLALSETSEVLGNLTGGVRRGARI